MTVKDEIVTKVREAVTGDQPAALRDLLHRHPALGDAINEPLAAFDSPLITCVRSREMLDVLLAAGADLNARSRWWAGGFGLLDHASADLSAYAIARGARVDVHAAARLGRFDELKSLIAANPELVRARGGDGQTPLHFAATVEIAEFLLAHGAAIDARDVDHESTPAQYMVRDRQEVARALLRRGCATDLLLASALGEIDAVQRHLRADPGIVAMNVSNEWFPKRNPKSGGTIYQWALGANKTAHVVAREFGHEEVFRLLMKNSPALLQLAAACEVGDEPAVAVLLAAHPNLIQSAAENDRRKIADAARNNQTAAVRLMLKAGWPVDARGQHGATPLHWAAYHGNTEMAAEILRWNPPLEATDRDYQETPMGWARHGKQSGGHRNTGDYPATCEALLRAGAKPTG